MLKQKICWVGLAFVMLLMMGCISHGRTSYIHWSGMTHIYPLETKRALVKRLALSEIQVVEQGDHLRILIPVDNFFNIEKSRLRASKEPDLGLVAKLVLLYGRVPVFIQGYSDNVGYDRNNIERTMQQANDIAAVLWSQGVDQWRIQVEGYGSRFPIANNKTVEGREMNRRIEVKI